MVTPQVERLQSNRRALLVFRGSPPPIYRCYSSNHSNVPTIAVFPAIDPLFGFKMVILFALRSRPVLRADISNLPCENQEYKCTYTTTSPSTVKSRISSSYLSFSSGLNGAMIARSLFSNPDPGRLGSTEMGCISDTTRFAPIGSAEAGAMASVDRPSPQGRSL